MYFGDLTKGTQNSAAETEKLKKALDEADAVLIGAGAGLVVKEGIVCYNGILGGKYTLNNFLSALVL